MSIVPVGGTTYCGPEAGTTTINVLVNYLPTEPKLQSYSVVLDLPTGVTITGAVNGGVLGGSLGITDPVIRNGNEVYVYAMGESQSTQAGTLVTITLSHPVDLSTLMVEFNADTILSDPDGYVISTGTMTGTTINREIAIVQNTGTSAYYCTLASAVTEAVSGETLKVLRDFSVSSMTYITKQITLDTNGKTITSTSTWNPIFMVYSTGDFTITGGGVLNAPSVFTITLANFAPTGQPKLTLQNATISGLRQCLLGG